MAFGSLRFVAVRVAAVSCMALAAAVAMTPSEALARKNGGYSGGGWGWFGDSAYDYEPRYYKPKPRAPKRKAAPKTDDAEVKVPTVAPYKATGAPLFLMVSLKKQRISVYDSNNVRIADAPISSGRIGYSTPTGVFTILEKNKVHFSNLYENAPMPNMQRITWSGVALHAGDLPGYPASHGCVRLPRNFSQQLFSMTKMGQRVVVSRDAIEPVEFSHPRLFQSYPPDALETAAIDKPVQTVSAHDTNPAAMTQTLELAAADASPAPPPVSPMRAKRQAERAAAEAAFDAAKAERTKLEEAAKAAVTEATAARTGIRAAQVEVAKLQKFVRDAEVEHGKGELQLANYTKQYSGVSNLTAEEQASAAEEEKLLEANVLALSDGVEAAKRAVEAAKGVVAEAEKVAADIDQKRREAIHALSEVATKVRTTGTVLANLKAADALHKYPVSVYISRKNSRLYVRQNQKPVFDVPVTFANPEQPLGTQVYTALDYTNASKTELRWNVISIPSAAAAKADTRSRLEKLKAKVAEKQDQQVPAPIEAVRQSPRAALERVTIDDATRERISDVMKPGSSVIISDHGLGTETGQYTDFIVLTNQ